MILDFDTVVCSEAMEQQLRESVSELAPPAGGLLGMFAGVKIVANQFTPDRNIVLMKGDSLVAVLILAK